MAARERRAARRRPRADDLRRVAAAPILDEEALRGVVNRIVREELQGELGDRISRNLRKLIRREMSQLHRGAEGAVTARVVPGQSVR
jgi:hypothetical protein